MILIAGKRGRTAVKKLNRAKHIAIIFFIGLITKMSTFKDAVLISSNQVLIFYCAKPEFKTPSQN